MYGERNVPVGLWFVNIKDYSLIISARLRLGQHHDLLWRQSKYYLVWRKIANETNYMVQLNVGVPSTDDGPSFKLNAMH